MPTPCRKHTSLHWTTTTISHNRAVRSSLACSKENEPAREWLSHCAGNRACSGWTCKSISEMFTGNGAMGWSVSVKCPHQHLGPRVHRSSQCRRKIINLIISIKVSSAAHQCEMKKVSFPADIRDKLLLAAGERWCERTISKQWETQQQRHDCINLPGHADILIYGESSPAVTFMIWGIQLNMHYYRPFRWCLWMQKHLENVRFPPFYIADEPSPEL